MIEAVRHPRLIVGTVYNRALTLLNVNRYKEALRNRQVARLQYINAMWLTRSDICDAFYLHVDHIWRELK